jgi:Skp family chaperone for outer membrane proteins
MKFFTQSLVLFFILTQAFSANQKIGVVNMSKVLFHYDEVKILRIQISNQEARYQTELNQQEKEAEELNVAMKDPKLSETQRLEMEKDFSRRLFNLQRKFEEYKTKIEEQQEKELEKIHGKVLQEIKQIAAQKRLDLVLEERQVFFGNVEDLTDELIERLNNQGGSSATGQSLRQAPATMPAGRLPRTR